jgi:hypothetical protein
LDLFVKEVALCLETHTAYCGYDTVRSDPIDRYDRRKPWRPQNSIEQPRAARSISANQDIWCVELGFSNFETQHIMFVFFLHNRN